MIIFGAGGLGQELADYFDASLVGRDLTDFSDRASVYEAVQETLKSEDQQIVTTVGVLNSNDHWDLLISNYVGVACFVTELVKQTKQPLQIVVVSSLAARWTAWPDISPERISYNVAKSALSEHMAALSHSGKFSSRISVLEPGRFQSPMSNYDGIDIKELSQMIDYMFNAPDNVEFGAVEMRHKR